MLELICDSRELKIKNIFEKIEHGISVKFTNLELGDFVIKNGDDIILIIERKTTSDLYSSIRDGRYKEQKIRLINNFKKSQILYIIEGPLNNSSNYYKNFSKIVKGSILNMIYRDKLTILRTEHVNETTNILIAIFNKIVKNPEFFTESINNETNKLDYCETVKVSKKDNMTPEMCSIIQISQIPGVSLKTGKIIIQKYGSIYNLIKTYDSIALEKDKLILLKDIPVSEKRKLGPKLSQKIYEYLVYK